MKKLSLLIGLLIIITACQNNEKEASVEKNQAVEKQEKKPAFDHKAYKMKGMLIAKNTFQNFKSKIESIGQKEGLPSVVHFCNDNAQKLADSLGKIHKVEIRRTSHKLRNPDSKPNADQEAVINNYLQLQEDQNKQMEPVIMKDEQGYVHFYAPIKLKEKCLQCHGQVGKDIHDDVYKVIKEKYPQDKATGFKVGELRGIWDIKFLEKPGQ